MYYKESLLVEGLDTWIFESCLIANLQVKVTWFGVEAQVNSVSIVTDDVFGSWVLAVASSHQLL